eukprot:Em0024g72a
MSLQDNHKKLIVAITRELQGYVACLEKQRTASMQGVVPAMSLQDNQMKLIVATRENIRGGKEEAALVSYPDPDSQQLRVAQLLGIWFWSSSSVSSSSSSVSSSSVSSSSSSVSSSSVSSSSVSSSSVSSSSSSVSSSSVISSHYNSISSTTVNYPYNIAALSNTAILCIHVL